MAKESKYAGKLAVGVYVEGALLHVVCLARRKNKIRLVNAEIVRVARQPVVQPAEEQLIGEVSNLIYEDNGEFSEEPHTIEELLSEPSTSSHGGSEELLAVLNQLPRKKLRIAFSLPEPYIYYAYFFKDFDLKGKKLEQRLIGELSKERTASQALEPEAIRILRLADGRLMVIVRDDPAPLYASLDALRNNQLRKMPQIEFVETAEISLVNLVKANYELKDGQITAIIHTGVETSRLIFLHGREILNISYIIGAGTESENIANTIYSRLLLEQDNLNLQTLNRIILAGEAFEAGLEKFLRKKLPESIEVEHLSFERLGMVGLDPLLSRFAVPMGSALRALGAAAKDSHDIDITPYAFRDNQKRFKLGILGWIFLLIIPFLTFYMTVQVSRQHQELTGLQNRLQAAHAELDELHDMEKRLDAQQEKLANYEKATTVLDSMNVSSNEWSGFLEKVSGITRDIGNIWVTDIVQTSGSKIQLKGYSLQRGRIPEFSDALRKATLNKVEVQEIRKQRVYNFEIELYLSKQ